MRLRVESQSSLDLSAENHQGNFEPQQIAESNIYTPTEKADFYQRYLEQERLTGFQKLLSESQDWPLNWRHALDEALTKTPLALGYATRLSIDDQIKFLDRMLALGYNDNGAAETFVEIVNAATLSNISSRLQDLRCLGQSATGETPGSGMYFMKKLAERSADMSHDAQKKFATSIMDFNIFENDFRRNEAFRRQLLITMFAKMSPDATTAVFDELQKANKAFDLLKMFSGEFESTQE
jgi:hypothetical protein